MFRTTATEPLFYNFMLEDNADKVMKIPSGALGTIKLPDTISIRYRRNVWPVKLLMEKGRVYFADGWEVFVKDMGLVSGDLLVFGMVNKAELVVEPFSTTRCAKPCLILGAPSPGVIGTPDSRQETTKAKTMRGKVMSNSDVSTGVTQSQSKEKEFIVSVQSGVMLRESNKYHLNLCIEFAQVMGLPSTRKVHLKDNKGKLWPVTFKVQTRLGRVSLTSGWKAFCIGQAFGLGAAMVLSCRMGAGNIIDVEVTKRGDAPLVYRSRGRPRKIVDAEFEGVKLEVESD